MMHSEKTLEFDKILDRLAAFTESETVKKRIYSLKPVPELSEARRLQRETSEAVSACLKLGNPPVNLWVENIVPHIRRAERSGTLGAAELISVSRLMYTARRMKAYLSECSEESDILRGYGQRLVTARELEDRINSAIISEDEIADDASPELSTIRRKIKNLNARIKESLNSVLHSAHYKKYLQDAIVTIKNDRYVIPVRSEYRSEVAGIVHDTSSTGATVFIEPMSVVNSNNDIRELRNREKREIERILSELTALVCEKADTALADYECISELDFIFCKAKLSLDYDGREPRLNDRGYISLKKARHPLIDKKSVVANDIILGGDFDTLVITGPNTGGKTVTLKTLGLFSLMAAAGLHLPTADNSEAAVFDAVFADIGDEQSIEQSLSTFSSHMVNIVSIIDNVGVNTLALFDELGAGTDPTEGAALAVAILEYLRERGVKIAATTHYSELKLFALSTEGVENASCEFDVETLRPTYKLLIGVPGKSNAFAISRRLGLAEAVITRAGDMLSDESVKFEDVITDLEMNRQKAIAESEKAACQRRETEELRRKLEDDREKLKESKSKILDSARREAKIIVMDARDEANSIIRDLESLRAEGKNVKKVTDSARDKLKKRSDSLDKQMERAAKPRKTYAEPPKELKPGQTVKIIDMDQEATVLKPPGKDGMARVQAGIFKMDVHVTNLKVLDDNSVKELAKKYSSGVTRSFESKAKNAVTEIDLRGQLPEEAVMNASKFIDDCYLAGISPVSIIHGKGTGKLRTAIREMCKKNKFVKSFRSGRFGEGEDGVTVVEIK